MYSCRLCTFSLDYTIMCVFLYIDVYCFRLYIIVFLFSISMCTNILWTWSSNIPSVLQNATRFPSNLVGHVSSEFPHHDRVQSICSRSHYFQGCLVWRLPSKRLENNNKPKRPKSNLYFHGFNEIASSCSTCVARSRPHGRVWSSYSVS